MSPAVVYVAVGALIGPMGLKLIAPDFAHHGRLIEGVSETVLLVAVFGAGLRLRFKMQWALWRTPVRFATVSLLGTMLLIALAAHFCFDLAFPAALLVAAILAPTDSLLAAEVRLPPTADDAGVRTLLTAESAIATVLAVPAVLLALGLVGVHELGASGFTWFTLDLLWAIAGGLALGWCSGVLAWRLFMRARSARDADLPEEIVAVGTFALACGAAMVLHTSPLAAVFAAGLALSHGGRRAPQLRSERPSTRFQQFSGRLEQIGGVAALLLLGALVHVRDVRVAAVIFGLIVVTLVRPLAARLAIGFSPLPTAQQRVAAWFGMRGIVSVYLLSVAVNHGLHAGFARQLAGIVLVVLVTCVLLHAVMAVPLIGGRADQRA